MIKDFESRSATLQSLLRELAGDANDAIMISSPGRTEVGGNHTDHQHGNVLAAAINHDVLMLGKKCEKNVINLNTLAFGIQKVDFSAAGIHGLQPGQLESQTEKLIRGVLSYLNNQGYVVGGFDAVCDSQVLVGSGLSSSAAFENAIGQMINYLYNDGKIPLTEIALAGQYAENVFINKGSGLMDQTASAFGGFVQIDFANPKEPKIQKVDFDFEKSGYALCITNTKGSHANLDDAYSSMPNEMKAVAEYFGKEVLNDVDETVFWQEITALKSDDSISDRAILRAIHYFAETKRAVLEAQSLDDGDFDRFISIVQESGNSSLAYLQNAWLNTDEQNITLGLALSQKVLQKVGEKPCGAWRVHGGGLAGTIQAFVPLDLLSEYRATLDSFFGEGSCEILQVRNEGAVKVDF